MVIRPKSRATVVVVLSSIPPRLSMPTLAVVMSSSVFSGSISLAAPTKVVFPTPKPPAIRILTWVGNGSDSFKAIEQLLQEVSVGGYGGGTRGPHGHGFTLHEVGEEHLGDDDGEAHVRGHLGDGDRATAEPEHLGVLEIQAGRCLGGRDHQREEVEFDVRTRTAGAHRVRAYQGTGVLVEPYLVVTG